MIFRRIAMVCVALAGLAACAPTDYANHQLVAKYDYDGVRYDVYKAEGTNQEENGVFTVYRLVPEGQSPLGNPGTSMDIGGDNVIANCEASLEGCRTFFGKILEKRKAAASGPQQEDGGMY